MCLYYQYSFRELYTHLYYQVTTHTYINCNLGRFCFELFYYYQEIIMQRSFHPQTRRNRCIGKPIMIFFKFRIKRAILPIILIVKMCFIARKKMARSGFELRTIAFAIKHVGHVDAVVDARLTRLRFIT